MASTSSQTEYGGYQSSWPTFYIGQHDSDRWEPLDDNQYGYLLDAGFSFATAPITNRHFRDRVFALQKSYLDDVKARDLTDAERANPSFPGPTVPTLTDEDTSLFPGRYITSVIACSSAWIDLYSDDPLVANLSRQVLNLEVAYASFCGVRSIIVPGPRADSSGKQVAQYARAIQEALRVASRVSLVIQMPMYREPGLEEAIETLSGAGAYPEAAADQEIDLYSCWDTWHTIRTVCDYSARLSVALRVPRRLPEIELQSRWFAEPLQILTFSASIFQENASGYPSLSKNHKEMINKYMRLKMAPWMLVSDGGPDAKDLAAAAASGNSSNGSNGSNSSRSGSSEPSPSRLSPNAAEFPTPAESRISPPGKKKKKKKKQSVNAYLAYLRFLEQSQQPYSDIETSTLTSFQDWLQSPLQPLADNLESATYEVFEGDPVKYVQYEKAITAAMADWKALKRPTSALPRPDKGKTTDAATAPTTPELVVAVAGAGRGPLVTRVIRASLATGVPVQLWALEKNQNAYVYLLRMNKQVWGGKVHVIKTDMRDWAGPVAEGHEAAGTTTRVDILVSELLGSFGDNELSPECIDGIQRHIARPHGISIPHSYTAHLSPVSYPRVYADLFSRSAAAAAAAAAATTTAGDEGQNAFETPWVVHLFAVDLVSQKVPGRPRFQQAWEFVHPVRLPAVEDGRKRLQIGGGGGGAMALSAGLNEHNARHCHLTFVCRPRGVIHGLAGYFESVLYQPAARDGDAQLPAPVEISTRPDRIDQKSKDMISWFPIFFPLKKPMYFPQDAEIEVSMWRQTDDTKVWYEWLVEVHVWVGPTSRVKVATSELHSSRKVACLM